MSHISSISLASLLLLATAWSSSHGSPWNDPYPRERSLANTLYGSFAERPKHLDPARSYSADEYRFIAQIYEPPLQYHFLKRPYQLVPLSLQSMPRVTWVDGDGNLLPPDADPADVAFSDYEFDIQPGIRFQPHPALARDGNGGYVYHALSRESIAALNRLGDLPESGTRELLAEDFVNGIKRMADPAVHSPIAGVMKQYIVGLEELSAQIGGLRAGEARKSYIDLRPLPLAGVEVLGPHRYRIRIEGVYPQFLFWQAMPFFAPVPWEADRFYGQPGLDAKNISLDWYPIGTGPFYLTENNPNLRMVLTRNPHFHGEAYPDTGEPGDAASGLLDDAGAALPFVDAAQYSLEKESIPRWNKFLQGFYDNSGIGSDSFDQAVQFGSGGDAVLTDEMAESGISLSTAVATSMFYMGFNMLDPVVGGDSERARLLRRAISIAVDFEEFISIFLNGRGVAAQGPIPPGIFGHVQGRAGMNAFVFDWINGGVKRKSIDEAHGLMEQAGYVDGRDTASGSPLVLYFEALSRGPDDKARLTWMRKQFDKLGIQLVVRATDYNRFREKMLKGTGQIYMWGWNADYPDPENFLFLLYGPNAKVGAQGENASNYRNEAFDALFRRMKDMVNGDERLAIIEEMLTIARRDAPWSWGFYPKKFELHHDWLHNVKPNLMANNTLKYQRIDPLRRERLRSQWNPPVLWPMGLLLLMVIALAAAGVVAYRRREAGCGVVIAYIIRRSLYAIPILIGVNLLTFLVFFMINTPDDIARSQLGDRRVTEQAIDAWKKTHGYHKPMLYNAQAEGAGKLTDTVFFDKSLRLFVFDFGRSDSGRDIGHDVSQRMWPSLAIAVPTLVVGLLLNISFALAIALFHGTRFDFWAVVVCVAFLSVSSLFYIIGGQYVVSKLLHLVPISGYDTGLAALKFLVLPVVIGVVAGIGSGTRWYRTIFLEEMEKDYVRTARAKGLDDVAVMFHHVLKNALVPILTGVVAILPLLFMGSLLVESFFGIPGLGSYTIDGIQRQDFAIVRSMVFLGSVLYVLGLLLTDISYTFVDPRVRLSG